ncbi:5-bromo-4-chloroindolyl phosphate hydrolysis family protein [Sulfitobacter sp.]|mgnify:CR=1 FL=1|uniref:5-bromo-4-chloroindolyl phosphate hydrolysis family protein n=1 Tax=Sulfitobacter sp. TaxID=1903071 RepID=UPI003563502E|tara:strand:- start:2140 stop:3003 length:864 start_codon:yes stop_codon:yes gene_type:complete
MAQRFGGKYSQGGDAKQTKRIEVDPVGARSNLLFIPGIVLVFTSLNDGAQGLALGLVAAAALTGAALMLREGVKAEAAYRARKVAERPALPRKMIASALTGIGVALAAYKNDPGVMAAVLYGAAAIGLHVSAFGIDPLTSKGMEGVDSFQKDRVARVVDEAEKHLTAMSAAIVRTRDRQATERLEQFQTTARTLIRTVEEDPRDLTGARKYLSVYLQGARDATIKFADIFANTQDAQAKADYLILLDDLDKNFAARTQKSLLDDKTDLTIEIDVLRERLSQEGVRLK